MTDLPIPKICIRGLKKAFAGQAVLPAPVRSGHDLTWSMRREISANRSRLKAMPNALRSGTGEKVQVPAALDIPQLGAAGMIKDARKRSCV